MLNFRIGDQKLKIFSFDIFFIKKKNLVSELNLNVYLFNLTRIQSYITKIFFFVIQ